jgi:hypothetical protein
MIKMVRVPDLSKLVVGAPAFMRGKERSVKESRFSSGTLALAMPNAHESLRERNAESEPICSLGPPNVSPAP